MLSFLKDSRYSTDSLLGVGIKHSRLVGTSVLLSVKWALRLTAQASLVGPASRANLPQYIPQPGLSQMPHPLLPVTPSSHPLTLLGALPLPAPPGLGFPSPGAMLSELRLAGFSSLAGKDMFYRHFPPKAHN